MGRKSIYGNKCANFATIEMQIDYFTSIRGWVWDTYGVKLTEPDPGKRKG